MAERTTVGLIVNPIAGMGGSVGLKGTDGRDTLQQAISLGAEPLAARRTARMLTALAPAAGNLRLLIPPGDMGEAVLAHPDFTTKLVPPRLSKVPCPADTRTAALAMKEAGASLILFAGGDGTARDLVEAVGDTVPLIGIPCGVKMYSGVFATSPEAAGHLACDVIDGAGDTQMAEVMDIDEAAFRAGRLSAQLFGYAQCPRAGNRLQGPKSRSHVAHHDAVRSAATELSQNMKPGQIYLIGPGTSAKAVLNVLELSGTLLGVDAIMDNKIVGRDLSASNIRELIGTKPPCLILGVIGGQGYVLGRGNQQITSDVIKSAGRDGLIILSSEEKLAQLHAGRLLIDTGDRQLDIELEGFIRVHTGAGRQMMMQLSAGH